MDTSEAISKYLKDTYYGDNSSAAFAGARRLIEKARERNVSRKIIKEWLTSQDAYTQHKPIIRKFK
jgi:hypothetical protein